MHRFITLHIINTLPLHNLNRDQNGLPKTAVDGSVQRARLSSQSLKRAARNLYRLSVAVGRVAYRTRDAVSMVVGAAEKAASELGVDFDPKKASAEVKKVIASLTSTEANTVKKEEDARQGALVKAEKAARAQARTAGLAEAETEAAVQEALAGVHTEFEAKKTIVFIAAAEIATLAHAVVEKQRNGGELELSDAISDASSPSLEIAAFGRMFAAQTDLGTHAAVAVSHAITSHKMSLVTDYFSAVEDGLQTHAGAAHLGMNYFTSGVYYRTVTIDLDQLRRSWAAIGEESARDDLRAMTEAVIRALPTGKMNSTNGHIAPTLVLAEMQAHRIAYDFDTPVSAAPEGGFKEATVHALADKRRQALAFDAATFGEAVVAGELFGEDFSATQGDLEAVVSFVVESVLGAEDA